MTLREFFEYLGEHPYWVIGYFAFLPMLALTTGWIARDEGRLAPWRYVYMLLIYGVCIPGIFAVTLSVYLFLFERGSVMNLNLYTQVLPILSMVFTLVIIRRNVSFEEIPGFDRLSSLMMMIGAVIVLMYLLDRTRIIAFVRLPVGYLVLIVVGMLLAIRFGFRQLVGGGR
jgi:hypothetical protein